MGRTLLICISEDQNLIQKTKEFGQANGVSTEAFHPTVWSQGLEDANFRMNVGGETPTLVAGGLGGKVLPFPGPMSSNVGASDAVATINQLEAKAIEQAIQTFRGNLTEAAKALGIGRATLYRKVKLYNIDPSNARRKKAA
jgi:DNA-binding NtrC family response regulator